MKSNRGVSLVELLLALSACGVILTLSTGLIERIMRAEMRSRDYVNVERTALRLSNMFRRDVWQAAEATISADGAKEFLRLSLGAERSLEYRQQSGTIVRTHLDGEQAVSREYFAFPNEAEIRFEQPSPRLITLRISIPTPPTNGESDQLPHNAFTPPIHLEIAARIARDAAFQPASLGRAGQP